MGTSHKESLLLFFVFFLCSDAGKMKSFRVFLLKWRQEIQEEEEKKRENREEIREEKDEDDGDDKLREEVLCLPRFYNKVTFSIKKDVKKEKKKKLKFC